MFRLRYITIIPVVFSLAGSALMFIIGAAKTIDAITIYFFHRQALELDQWSQHLTYSERAMISVVESVDAFLIGLVLLVFAFGVYTLYIGKLNLPEPSERWSWMRIHSIERLKQVLTEVVLVVLAVLFVRLTLYEAENLHWELLVLPVGIALIALAIKLVGWHGRHEESQEKQDG